MKKMSAVVHPPSIHRRVAVAWALIAAFLLAIVAVCAYNASAVMMLFGKGHVTLNDYDHVVEIVQAKGSGIGEYDEYSDGENGSIQYKTSDGVGNFLVTGQSGVITQIDAQIDLQTFAALGIFEKYQSINIMLRPICASSDILAAEIAMIRLSSELALSGFIIGQPVHLETSFEQVRTQLSQDRSHVLITIVPAVSAGSNA